MIAGWGRSVIKQISAVVIAAALVAALIGVLTWPGEAQQRNPSLQGNVITASAPPVFDQSYTAGMRIIQVPQPGAARQRAAPKASYREEIDAIDNDVKQTPAPQRHRVVTSSSQQQQRRILAPPDKAKRTMLNPPNSLHDGPSPMRPLPRWRGIEKFTELPKQVTPSPIADPVAAAIPPQRRAPTASASEIPVIDDDAPPPTD